MNTTNRLLSTVVSAALSAFIIATAALSATAKAEDGMTKQSILLEAGAAYIPGMSQTKYGFGALSYFHQNKSSFGWHMSAGRGFPDAYTLLSGAFDYHIGKGFYAGAGGGFAYPMNSLGGNPIILPLPEAGVGYLQEINGVTVHAGLQQNMFLGTRISAGLGWAF